MLCSLKSNELEISSRYSGAVLTIDLTALIHNFRILVRRSYPAKVAVVVKANAYGLGVETIAPTLYKAGARLFFVAQTHEALMLKPLLPDDANIAILNDFQPGTGALVAQEKIWPVLNSLSSINEWQSLCENTNKRLPAIIQIDTGITRLGLKEDDLNQLNKNSLIFQYADIKLIISHLTSADDEKSPMNFIQLQEFKKKSSHLPQIDSSLANSGGIFLGPQFKFDFVRPGIALYGIDPSGENNKFLRPTVRLDASIIQVCPAKKGSKIGYNSTYEISRDSVLATVAVGYADGWHYSLSNKGKVYFNDQRLPIIGKISMDSMVVDATDLKGEPLKRGDYVELIGKNQTIDQVAYDANTISYEILTSLGSRFYRHYIFS